MTSTITGISTYTKVDIRKTFEGFDADLRMIARRTGKWSTEEADRIMHDIIKLAEDKYLYSVDIVLVDTNERVLRATKYIVNTSGTAMNAERAGGNDWPATPNTQLKVILAYTSEWWELSETERNKFRIDNSFQINWGATSIDNSFPHLSKSNAQLYASKGYELQKQNYR